MNFPVCEVFFPANCFGFVFFSSVTLTRPGTPLNEAWAHLRAPGLAKAYWKLSEEKTAVENHGKPGRSKGCQMDGSWGAIKQPLKI